MSRQILERLLGELELRLAPQGFERVKGRFYLPRGSEFLTIELERLRNSDDAHLLVRGYAGLTCETVARFMGLRRLVRRPTEDEFGALLGEFFQRDAEAWWLVEDSPDPNWAGARSRSIVARGDAATVADQIARVVLEHVLPAAAPFTSDEAIRDHLVAGGNFGRSGVHPFYVAILAAKYGPPEAFEAWSERVLARRDSPLEYYGPLIERLRRGEFYAPGFAPGEKCVPRK